MEHERTQDRTSQGRSGPELQREACSTESPVVRLTEQEKETPGEFRLSFAATEAYKMLRTKINLVLSRESENEVEPRKGHICRIIGLTSALRGEGKSTTAANLTYTIAEAGHRVCIIEADMRLPNLGKRLKIDSSPGLSNILTGQCTVQAGIHQYTSKNNVSFSAITAGDIPPTPSELLESKQMERLLKALSTQYDFIIVDLPPATVVTDAFSVSKLLDGMLLVVRQNYCDKRSLKDVLYQLKLTGTKTVGIVFNCSEGNIGRTGYYRKNRKYDRKYYGYGYKAGRGT